MQKIREISLFINNTCNLGCPYCYVKKMAGNEELITNEKWVDFLSAAMSDKTKLVSIVGKEPFMTPGRTIDLLTKLNKFPRVQKGIVSNLTLVTPEIAKQIANIKNLYIDVSLDGIPEVHNKLRGEGTIEKSLRGLDYLRETGFNNIFVSHMCLEKNMKTFSQFVSFCADNGLKKIVIFPYCNTSRNDPLLVNPKKYCQFIDQIMQLNFMDVQGMEIIIKTDYLSPEIQMGVTKQFIDIKNLKEDESGVLYNEFIVSGNTFYLNFLPFPVEFIFALRINYDGNVIFCRDMMRKNISQKAIGNIKEGYYAIKNKIKTSAEVKKFYQKWFNDFKKM